MLNYIFEKLTDFSKLLAGMVDGQGGTSALIYLALVIVFAVLLAGVVYSLLSMWRNRLEASKRRESLALFVRNTQKPAALLTLFYLLFEAIIVTAQEFAQINLSSAEAIQGLMINGVMVWILWNYIGHFERKVSSLDKKEVDVKFLGDRVERGAIIRGFLFLRIGLLVIFVLMVLQQLGVSIASILAIGGFGGIVVGYATKDFTSNILAGFRIYSAQLFEKGDWIRCPSENIEGVVEDIGMQVTMIRTFDKRPMFVPNAKLVDNVIENPQRMTNRRIFEYFTLRYDDMERLPEVLKNVREMLANHDEIDKNQIIMVNLDRFADYSLDFFIYCMTSTTDWAHYHQVKEDILLTVAAIVKKAGADFAYPTSTVQVSSDGDAAHASPYKAPEPGGTSSGSDSVATVTTGQSASIARGLGE